MKEFVIGLTAVCAVRIVIVLVIFTRNTLEANHKKALAILIQDCLNNSELSSAKNLAEGALLRYPADARFRSLHAQIIEQIKRQTDGAIVEKEAALIPPETRNQREHSLNAVIKEATMAFDKGDTDTAHKVFADVLKIDEQNPISLATEKIFLETPRHAFITCYREWGTKQWHEVDEDNLLEHPAYIV